MSRAIIRAADQGRVLEIGSTRNRVKLAAEESGGLVGAVEMELGPGFPGPPAHRHLELDHLWYVIEGTVNIIVDGEPCVIGPGAFAYVPRGIPHTFSNPGSGSVRLLEVDTPRTLDAYFTELSGAIPPNAPVDPAIVADIQRRHDTIPLSPG